MARNPRTETITLAAGASRALPISGRWLLILSNTAASVQVGFDRDSWMTCLAGIPYPASDGQYDVVRFWDQLGGGATIVAIFSDNQIMDNRGSPLAAAMAASLASIDQEISGAGACTQLASVNVAATGLAGTQLFAANPNRTIVSLTARDDNAGLIYIGNAGANVSDTDFMDIIYPGGNWYDERYKGAIFAVGDDANEWVGGYEV